jgi:hypothetical protein
MTLKALTASATAEGERKYVTQNVISNILLKERICHV